MAWETINNPFTGRIACRFDPTRDLLEFQERGRKFTVDLNRYREGDDDSDRPEARNVEDDIPQRVSPADPTI